MESSPARAPRFCQVCGLAVGSYEPAVFVFGDEAIHSSRAAKPGLAAQPGCQLEHEECHADFAELPHLRLV